MKESDLQYICTVIGNLSGIPIRLFKNNKQVFYYSIVGLPKDPMRVWEKEMLSIENNVGYYISPMFNFYGIVNCSPYKIVLGPTRQVAAADKDLKELAFRADVPKGEINDFLHAMKNIVQMPYESIMQMLCVVNFVLNGEKLTLEDIAIYDHQQNQIKTTFETEIINKKFNEEYAEQPAHNTFDIEQQIMNIVRKGETASLKKWFNQAPAVRAGVLATDQLRQQKNTFIVTTTLVSRAAIQGGMTIDDALALSDTYIQKCEILNTFEALTNLQYRMVLDFTEHVEKLHIVKNPSKLATDVANYVQHHISETITTEDIAAYLFISRPHLSKKFKAETGINLNEFIMQEKIEEAKRLLRYSDKTSLAISSYLGFASQSHFSKVFKKFTGKTPNEYRELHNK